MHKTNIKLCLYKSIYEAYVHKDEQIECSFEELVNFFNEEQKLLVDKTDGLLFNCLDYKTDYLSPTSVRITDANPDDYIRRCKENVDKIYCLLLDVDGTMTLDDAISQWCDYEFLVYSTHSNSIDKEKFRLVIPLAIPLTSKEFDSRHESMIEEFRVDGASFTISQCFYLPSYNENNKDVNYVYWNKSDNRYDATVLQEEIVNYHVHTVKPMVEQKSPIKLAVFHTLLSGSDLHYSDALALAILCKSKGISSSEYKHIVFTISHPESDLRTKKVDLDKLYKQGFDSFMTDQKAIKLMNKLNCNMWRFNMTKIK
jgi:hypothetical protein